MKISAVAAREGMMVLRLLSLMDDAQEVMSE